jgi:hypothetical protein
MGSKPEYQEGQNAFRVSSIQAGLETAIAFGKLSMQSDDETEIISYRLKACDAYEDALHCLRTTALNHMEWESINTKIEHLASLIILPDSDGTKEI